MSCFTMAFSVRSRKNSAAGVGLSVWASPRKIRHASTPTACPNTPVQIWSRRVAFGQRRCQRSLRTRATSWPSGWTRRVASSTASTTPAPCCSSAESAPSSLCGPSSMSMAWPEGCSYWVSDASCSTPPIHVFYSRHKHNPWGSDYIVHLLSLIVSNFIPLYSQCF